MALDANKDEAVRCVSIAKLRLAGGQLESARKLTLKALRLYPSVSITGLESLIRTSRSPSRENLAPKPRSRKSTSDSPHSDSSSVNFTKVQAESVRKVLACKDYYELLGVSKESTEEDIKKAYKALALKFHPDKNRAPGATEAFKKIGTALGILTDPEKRRRYDQFGTDQEELPRITRVNRHGDPFFQYDADVFTMFFNGGFPFSQVYGGHRHRPARSRESERENNYFIYVQLIPLILIFALSFFSNLFVWEPHYNLIRSSKYPIEKSTGGHHIPYYVKSSFEHDFDGNLHQLETQIEKEFATNLRSRCFHEKEYRKSMLYRARYYGDSEGHDRALRMQLPACEQLETLFGG